MKTILFKQAALLMAGAFTSLVMHAQDYTWKKGTNATNQAGVFGSLGTPAPANNPGGRTQMASWKDAAGNFWLFGGVGVASNGSAKNLNDLWKYDPVTNQWALMKGSLIGDQSGTYGTIQVAAAANMPGGRLSPVFWTDQAGSFWLFGGNGMDATGQAGDLNDLWKYTPATNQWTWMGGSTAISATGTYGTMGTSAAANMPGSREGALSWADASGNLWLFGGYGYGSASGIGSLNDVWKYNIANNQWTWVRGANSTNQFGTYGTLGTAAATNEPGARSYSGSWTDASGNFWVQGGAAYGQAGSSNPFGIANDVWKYNPGTNQWTWMSGSNTITMSPIGVYGTQGVPAASNMPGGRGTGGYWTDALGNLWQLGGSGYGNGTGAPTSGGLNDLWKYNIAAGQWIWVKGNNTANAAGVYGTQGTAAAANTPGGRYGPASWTDNSGGLWFFGGYGYTTSSGAGYLNDLWKYQSCVNQTVAIQGAGTVCAGTTATLTASGASSFSWSAQQSGATITVAPVSTTGYTVQSADANSCGSSASATLTVNALPTVSAVSSKSMACAGESVTLTASGAATYSWNSGQTSASIQVVAANSVYTVTGTDSNGCKNTASLTQSTSICTGIEQGPALSHVSIYPNPTNGKITLSAGLGNAKLNVALYNTLGAQLASFSGQNMLEIDFSAMSLESGVYFIAISNNGLLSNQKIIYTTK